MTTKSNEKKNSHIGSFTNPLNNVKNNNYTGVDIKIPAVNIEKNEKEYFVSLVAPGLKKEDFKIGVDHNTMSISCEKKENNEPNEKKYIQKEYNYAAFKRTFALPQDVNKNKIDAKYEDGILNILLPFNEDIKQTPIKRIAVK